LHVTKVVEKLRGERVAGGGSDTFIAHPIPVWDCI
jgi:hypothetical protein